VSPLNYLAHIVLKDRKEKNLLLVYFPLHFTVKPIHKSDMSWTNFSRIPTDVLNYLLKIFVIEVTADKNAVEEVKPKLGLL
jgi:hypothetical protein